MKKKTIANLIMVLTIALIVAVGALVAWFLIEPEESIFGSEFHRVEIPDNRLVTDEDTQNLCTITIRCDTIFDNVDSMEEAKLPYVPEDGVILPVITVEFTPGETVFDVLKRVCEAGNLQIEYSWTPLYDSYYISIWASVMMFVRVQKDFGDSICVIRTQRSCTVFSIRNC